MKKVLFAATIILAMLTACDDTTDTLGSSLTNPADNLSVSVDTFTMSTRSVKANAVLCRSLHGYLGKIKDPETGNYITGDFMTQISIPEVNFFPPIDSLYEKKIEADSCDIALYFTSFYGDSLTAMKSTLYELEKPQEESKKYYSDFDPFSEGLVRTNGLKISKTHSIIDYNYSDSLRNSEGWMNNVVFRLDGEYTDKDGKTYNNYGTYLMAKYYEDPSLYKDSYTFIHNVCPGFLIKNTGGIGAMAEVAISQMRIYYKEYSNDKKYSIITPFYGTEEVLQGTRLTNNSNALDKLVDEKECTYIKSPAGIYTEITLPVTDIMKGHEKDSISSARIVLQALNDKVESNYNLPKPKQLMLIESDSLKTFFEEGHITNNERSYLASYVSSQNNYTFTNISILVQRLYKDYTEGIKAEGQEWLLKHPNWNKLLLVPVTTETATTSSTTVITRVAHDLSMTSTRLVGGADNPYSPVRISIIYSKFAE